MKSRVFSLGKFILSCITLFYCLLASVMASSSLSISKNKSISYTDVGKGEPLVLIHAFPTDERLWDAQREGLKDHFRVITLDLWGFGKSSPVDGKAITMTEYAYEVKQLLDQLQIHQAIIGGESMGGYIALAFLEKYPDKVSGLVLSDTQSIADSEEAKAKREETAVSILQNGTAKVINDFILKALTAQASEKTREFLKGMLESQTPTALASALRGMSMRTDTSHLLSNTQLPILIITGDQDAVISPKQSESMHQLAANSKLVIIANTAHLPSLEKPAEWNQAVLDMFKH